MKLPIVAGGALVVGLAGGTVMGMHGKPAPVAADSVVKAAPVVPPPAAAPTLDSTPPAAATDSSALPAPAPVKPAAATLDTDRMAASFAKLSVEDVTPLAERLSDVELEAVLRRMGVNRASAIIAALPKARGQLISKRILMPAGGAK